METVMQPVQQGHSKQSGEEVHTALRVGRSPFEWILANGKAPQRFRSPRNSTSSL